MSPKVTLKHRGCNKLVGVSVYRAIKCIRGVIGYERVSVLK